MDDSGLIEDLARRYRGLRIKDLNSICPEYSCVICGDRDCDFHLLAGCCCPDHIHVTEAEWIAFYNFY